MDKNRVNALVVIDKQRKRKYLMRRSYLKKVKCARQNYKPEDVLAAMRAIWRGMSRRQASKMFNIPRSTLLDKLDGKRPVDASPGPNPFLTKTEERTLESWALDLNRRGFPLKTEDLKDMAQAVIQNSQRQTSFKNGRPGRSWMRNFLLRHPKVYEISTDMVPGPRRSRTVTTREDVRQWCQHHRHFMASIGHESILNHPDRIFNVDHGEFMFDSATGYLMELERNDRSEEKDRERPEFSERHSAGTESVSVVATFTAAGGTAPLMFVYPSKDFTTDLANTFPSNWVATHSECGLLTGNLFLDYIISFRKWLEQEDISLPVLLLVDGRRSRLNIDVTRYCEEQGIILYCMFPTPRPAISELFSSVFHVSSDSISKFDFATRFHQALHTSDASETLCTNSVLPHLLSMLQTMAEVRAEPLISLSAPIDFLSDSACLADGFSRSRQDESDCEFDSELTPIEGEIEIELPDSEIGDPYALALHPALLADPDIPSYLIFKSQPLPPAKVVSSVFNYHSAGNPLSDTLDDESSEDRVEQPDVKGHLIVKPLSSPVPETENRLAQVESEISDVLNTLLAIGISHKANCEELQTVADPCEDPFLGFPSDNIHEQQSTLDAYGCSRFVEKILHEKGLLEDFQAARILRQWNGVEDAKLLFDIWLAAIEITKPSKCCI